MTSSTPANAMDPITAYGRAQQLFTDAVESLGDDPWQEPTACSSWTVGDVMGHATWGQDLIRSLAEGAEFNDRRGAPGSSSPAEYLNESPLTAWLRSRDRAIQALTPESLTKPLPKATFGPNATVLSFAEILEFDSIVHSWDITSPQQITIPVSEEQLARAYRTAKRVMRRQQGFFEQAVDANPADDSLTQLMKFCGRSVPPVSRR